MDRRAALLGLACLVLPAVAAAVPRGLALLLVESPGCPFCAAFRREVLPGYSARAEGRAAPVVPVPLDGPWPDGLALAGAPYATPTFILLRDRVEIGRFQGYESSAWFWRELGALLADAG
ncbi:hypothetical protein [Paracoccus alkenifer]|uniref:SoxS protein n=1 Tax=Paracoccus alkenifer TaxID=65735 RepID=A0A1H6LNC8_9RHOB|nr:hypothetical protein [Paracoccus alkenifer]SEH87678.1 hypothetical protein SAMN04488075_1575 [Paracoccus alkenifer]